jgi:hypothetical protein
MWPLARWSKNGIITARDTCSDIKKMREKKNQLTLLDFLSQNQTGHHHWRNENKKNQNVTTSKAT